MEPLKRIEIITGLMELEEVEAILVKFGIRGYMIYNAVAGKGNRQLASPSGLTGEFEDRVVTTTCAVEEAGPLVAALEHFVRRHGGACIVYDALGITV